MSKLDKMIGPDERKKIKQAVEKAELKTSGEIVPFLTEQSDSYEEAPWKGGYFTGTLALGFLLSLDISDMLPVALTGIYAGLGFFVFAILGYLLTMFIPPVKKYFAGASIINRRVEQRAYAAFIQEEVFLTRERTGILLYISLFEHKVFVLGDSGINSKVKSDDWNGIVDTIVSHMKNGEPVDGIIRAIEQCGELLEKAGVAIRKDDQDELSNELRT